MSHMRTSQTYYETVVITTWPYLFGWPQKHDAPIRREQEPENVTNRDQSLGPLFTFPKIIGGTQAPISSPRSAIRKTDDGRLDRTEFSKLIGILGTSVIEGIVIGSAAAALNMCNSRTRLPLCLKKKKGRTRGKTIPCYFLLSLC